MGLSTGTPGLFRRAVGVTGTIYAVNGEVYIKELGDKCLISHNDDKYKPIKLGAADSVYCCGRVVGIVEE